MMPGSSLVYPYDSACEELFRVTWDFTRCRSLLQPIVLSPTTSRVLEWVRKQNRSWFTCQYVILLSVQYRAEEGLKFRFSHP